MVQRTLTALFSLAVLILPASQLYADADGMTSVYSGSECTFQESRWNPDDQMLVITYAGIDDVVSHSRLGIGNAVPSSMGPTDAEYKLTVSCPLPALEADSKVAVAVIDGTVFDDVTCRVQSCVAGLGIGLYGVGSSACSDGSERSTNSRTQQAPYTQGDKYITQNVDWLVLDVALPGNQPEEGLELPEPGREDQHISSLLCTLPEQDDQSPTAPGLASQDRMYQGVSYIQLYRVE